MELYSHQTKHERHGLRHTRLYNIWTNIKTRCYNVNDPHYERWGAKGITVCDEWRNSFKAFYDWAINHGYSDELTIDRIDCKGNYEPTNCRWVTLAEQNKNKSNVIIITYNGVSMNCNEWSKFLGLGKDTVIQRYRKGWTVEECLFGKKEVVNLCQ